MGNEALEIAGLHHTKDDDAQSSPPIPGCISPILLWNRSPPRALNPKTLLLHRAHRLLLRNTLYSTFAWYIQNTCRRSD
jgi:hypothetical protein